MKNITTLGPRLRAWPAKLAAWRPSISRPALLGGLEIILVLGWALYITSPYANLNSESWPGGSDYPLNLQLTSTWQNLKVCGDCILWNGSTNGGAPAFADMFTPVLNPFFIIATALWGAVNGTKALLIFSFALAGLAQLWLGRVLGLSRLARIWTAFIAAAGGQLTARMEMGHVVMVISIASASLMLAAALDLARTGRRRSVVALALTMALTLVSGQGYIQVGVMIGFLPALLIYWFTKKARLRPVWRSFILAAGLTVLLTAVFWVPLLHFWPNVQKNGDPNFGETQNLLYALLNLIISDRKFYTTDILGKPAFPAMFAMFIGWIPLALAMFGFWLTPRREIRTKIALFSAVFLIYLASTGAPFKLLQGTPLAGFFSLGRHPSLLQPIAIPLILAAAGWGLDGLRRLAWPQLKLRINKRFLTLSLQVILLIPLVLGVDAVRLFAKEWVWVMPVTDAEYPVAQLHTDTARWVGMPFGEFSSYPKAIEGQLKFIIYRDFTAWNWIGRTVPAPEIEISRQTADREDPAYTGEIGPYAVLQYPDRSYAYVLAGEQTIPCPATAIGGHIDVTCQTDRPGLLVVNESYYPGWEATVNGVSVPLAGNLIQLSVPPGQTTIQLRYRPWDVWLGLGLTLIGLALCIRLWRRPMTGLPEAVPLEEFSQPGPVQQPPA